MSADVRESPGTGILGSCESANMTTENRTGNTHTHTHTNIHTHNNNNNIKQKSKNKINFQPVTYRVVMYAEDSSTQDADVRSSRPVSKIGK